MAPPGQGAAKRVAMPSVLPDAPTASIVAHGLHCRRHSPRGRVLLGRTVWTYVFVSRDLVQREARRQAAGDVTALERAIFVGRGQDLVDGCSSRPRPPATCRVRVGAC
jgi:hypothetical protein